MRVNGDVWFDFTGNTHYTGPFEGPPRPADIDEIVGFHNSSGIGVLGLDAGESIWDIDDYYIANTDHHSFSPLVDFWGDHRIDYRAMTGAGGFADWTPSAVSGENFEMIDEQPHDADVTHNVSTASGGDIDTFAHETAVLPFRPIEAIQVIYAAKREQGGPSSMEPVIHISGELLSGTPRGNTTDYSMQSDVWETFTPVASGGDGVITVADYDARDIGYRKVT